MKSILAMILTLITCATTAAAQDAGSWQTTNIAGIHYALKRNSLQPDRWQEELQHTYDCMAPCTVDFDDRVTAIFMRYSWAQLNPTEGVYDFADLGAVLDKIHASGKVATLAIMTGKYTPDWVFEKGAQHIQTEALEGGDFDGALVPVPWDPIFLAAHKDLMDALSKYLRETPGRYETVAMIKNATSSVHSEEIRLMPADAFKSSPAEGDEAGKTDFRRDLCEDWAQAGYTEQKARDGMKTASAQIDAAFPDKYIGLAFVAGSAEFPTVNAAGQCTFPEKNETLNLIIQDLVTTYGPRAAVNSTVLSEKKGAPPILQWVINHGGKIGFQLNAQIVGCREKSRAASKAQCDPTVITRTFQAGIDAGATFIEVHDGNINSNKDLLVQMNAELAGR